MVETAGLLESIERLCDRRLDRRVLVSVTAEVDVEDPSSAVFGSRLAGDRWFCWEQPDRDGFALSALGSVHEAVSRGRERFGDLVGECSAVTRGRLGDEPAELPAGAGPVWVGGFAFDPDGGAAAHWSSFPPALLVLPELSLLRTGERTFLTLNAIAGPGDDERGQSVTARLERRLAGLREDPLPLVDPHPTGATAIRSVSPPSRHEDAVAAAVQRIRAGQLEKVVLAREVTVEAPAAHDPAAVFGGLRDLFPSCFCFCCGSPEGALGGASPELLVRRSGAGVST